MWNKIRLQVILVILLCWAGSPIPTFANEGPTPELSQFHPENTVFLSNELDGRVSRDYSTLLKNTRLPWIILETPEVPASIRDNNLILLGSLDSPLSGEIIQELLSPEELETLEAVSGQGILLQIESPWTEGRTVIICVGKDAISLRNGAERILHSLITETPPASDWIRTTYQAPRDENLETTLDILRYTWEDQELSIQELTMDIHAKAVSRISTAEAQEDVERLFSLLSHGYAGYGFFNQSGEFDQARRAILDELSSQSSWTGKAFSNTLHSHLNFITDCHLTIGEHRFAEHSDFWYDTNYELTPEGEGFHFLSRGKSYFLQSINGGDPQPYLYPSLNQDGNPVYRMGVLSPAQPSSLVIVGVHQGEEQEFKVSLKRSNFDYYSQNVFQEDLLGGIPVIRARSFGDYYQDILGQFTMTGAQHRGDPVLIVDIRGNGGGNEIWPINWIQRLTGQRANSVFVTSELKSLTSLMGRVNAFEYWIETAGINSYKSQLLNHTNTVNKIDSGERQAEWSATIYPPLPLIPNETTVVLITNDQVASAGEGFVLRSSQMENVLVVGENTMGCLTFGNISAHKLPNSNLFIWMPININIFQDGQIQEGIGLTPDLWVPSADAVNYAVAALRAGTISTKLPLAEETLQAKFVPESFWERLLGIVFADWPVFAIFCVATAVWAYFMRANNKIQLAVGIAWCLFGTYWILAKNPGVIHLGLLAGGIISLFSGIYGLVFARKEGEEK